MDGSFFADYKKFVVLPAEEQKETLKEFDPRDYATHFVLTLSLYDALISNWSEAIKYGVHVESSLAKALEEFNRKEKGVYHLKTLEIEANKSYFVLALSSKDKTEHQDANDRISSIIDSMISTPLYVGQSWYRLIGQKGRMNRRLFSFSFREYTEVGRSD